MGYVLDQARKVIEKYGLGEEVSMRKLLEICDCENILVKRYPLRGRVMERYIRTQEGIPLLTIRSGIQQELVPMAKIIDFRTPVASPQRRIPAGPGKPHSKVHCREGN